MVDEQYIRNHIRLDSDDDSERDTILSIMNAAIAYVESITGRLNSDNDSRFDLAVGMLFAHWYHNREAATGYNVNVLPYGLETLLTNIKVSGDYFV